MSTEKLIEICGQFSAKARYSDDSDTRSSFESPGSFNSCSFEPLRFVSKLKVTSKFVISVVALRNELKSTLLYLRKREKNKIK